ncbi:MAG: c-type cytochrome [Phycisphaerae bacterium]|nr:c-type cytochrome [Phycisphaerae bacterium]
MRRLICFVLPVAIVASIFFTARSLTGQIAPDSKEILYLSPARLVSDSAGTKLYIAQYEGKKIDVFEVKSKKITKSIALDASVNDLCISADDNTLYVTTGQSDGCVCIIDTATGHILKRIKVGYSPIAPALSADGKTLYVCNRFNDNVDFVDLINNKVKASVPVEREPYASVLSKDGRWLFVANHLPRRPAAPAADDDGMDFTVEACVSVIDTQTAKEVKRIDLPDGAVDLRGLDISPDGKFVYVTHILARYNVPTSQLERGWIDTNALSAINVADQKLYKTVLLDDVQLGAANPYKVKCSDDGKYIAVTISGTHEIHVIDRLAMHAKLDTVVKDDQGEIADPLNYLPYMQGLRKRVNLEGNGPRGLALIGNVAYATQYFSDSLALVDLQTYKTEEIPLGPDKPVTQIRKGERLFHDANLCYQKWLSCASCHPDVRTDGINWDLMNDGASNPKNAKSLVLAHATPPSMITGIRASAEVAVRAGLKYIQFSQRPEEDAQAIDAFLISLKPLPSPYLVNGQLSEAAKRGKLVFEKAYCIKCHDGQYHTNMKKYDLHTTYGVDLGVPLDTPTLSEVWRTAPYLHDGAATSIMDVLTKFNPEDKHGKTSHLTEQELKDLAAYVLSL